MASLLHAQSLVRPRSPVARIFGAPVLSDQSTSLYRDVLGQLAVGDILDALDVGWVVLHAVPVDSRETAIDHVVIGPGGIFTVSTGYHVHQNVVVADREFRVGGTRENRIRETEFDVGRVERRLTAAAGVAIHVVGVIVVVEPRSLIVQDESRDVVVIDVARLSSWLTSRPHVLDASCVERVTEIAEKPSTWVSGAVRLNDGPQLRRQFARLHDQVREATRVHRFWLVALTVGLVGLLAVAGWGVVMQDVGGF